MCMPLSEALVLSFRCCMRDRRRADYRLRRSCRSYACRLTPWSQQCGHDWFARASVALHVMRGVLARSIVASHVVRERDGEGAISLRVAHVCAGAFGRRMDSRESSH